MQKVKKNFKYLSSVIITAFSFVLVIAFASSSVLSMAKSDASPIWAISLCFISVFLPNLYWFYMKKRVKKRIPAINMILIVFTNIIFLASLPPLFVADAEQTTTGVKEVVTNIYVFYGTALGFIILGFLITIYLLKDNIKKSNWWAFIASLPYIFTSWIMQRDYTSFKEFVHADNFSYENVANMLKDINADMLLLNPSWFKFLSILVIVLVLTIGMIAFEIIWKKTDRWRGKRKQTKTPAN